MAIYALYLSLVASPHLLPIRAVTQGTNPGGPFLRFSEDTPVHDDDLDALTEIALRPRTRAELEREYGKVWDEQELAADFIVTAIIAPTYIVRRRADNAVGSVLCQPRPLLYFGFRPSPPTDPA